MRISSAARAAPHHAVDFAGRRKLLLAFMLLAMLALIGRAVYLQILNKAFLQVKADMQHVGVVPVSAYRGQDRKSVV